MSLRNLSRRRALAVLLVVAGCRQPVERTPQEWARDSAAYEEQLRQYNRREAVFDSIIRSADYSDLLRLQIAFTRSDNPRSLIEAVDCEIGRLMWDYGLIPANRIVEQVEDSLKSMLGEKAVAAAWGRLPAGTSYILPECPGRRATQLDESGGVSLGHETPPPVPPRPPSGTPNPWRER